MNTSTPKSSPKDSYRRSLFCDVTLQGHGLDIKDTLEAIHSVTDDLQGLVDKADIIISRFLTRQNDGPPMTLAVLDFKGLVKLTIKG